jgi:diguanylate cyclase (GGDEF)-like protein/putative nucleotidyltransferase with HDIG domain
MFGTRHRVTRPVLLILVYGIFLVIVGLTATLQTALVSADYSATTLNTTVSADAALVRLFVSGDLSPDDLGSAGLSTDRRAALETRLARLVQPGQILRIEVRRPDGRVVAANQPVDPVEAGPLSADFATALQGRQATAAIDDGSTSEVVGEPLVASHVVREYFPLTTGGEVLAVVGVWRDAAPILATLDSVRRNIILLTVSAGLIAAVVLYLVFRSAQGRISRQTKALVDAYDHDPLTGTLNHGRLVELVAASIEHARADHTAIGVAIIDIDNFRLLNETHGHDAGDQALRTVVDVVRRGLPADVALGRYGPDELLLIAPAGSVESMIQVLEQLRSDLVDHALQFGASERLPVTVSAGVCLFPDHADSVTALLTVMAVTLHEAKASGGDAIRVAGRSDADSPVARTFDVFQGLIFAVDTKDRYTKQHSEDVARYSVFLARRLGLDPEVVATIRVAGLLHDVGKIGIPDQILRKPAALTSDEYAIVKQHVALGDSIVRDLPDIDVIRAGVRHHHERWDGDGYLERLAGEEIPLVARILAVGDAFSAMTTTRPYRKALDIKEALHRLEDAAGSQLEERLVACFVEGIETAEDAPLPGADSHAARLWTPTGQDRHVA